MVMKRLKLLIDKGADINQEDVTGCSLSMASQDGRESVGNV